MIVISYFKNKDEDYETRFIAGIGDELETSSLDILDDAVFALDDLKDETLYHLYFERGYEYIGPHHAPLFVLVHKTEMQQKQGEAAGTWICPIHRF